ncbi:MAG: hypothetical protein WA823_09605 [Candidatus Acidiferrales bacterium]
MRSRTSAVASLAFLCRAVLASFVLLLALPAISRAQQLEDFDQYKLRIDTYWFYSTPSGSVQGSSDQVPVDFQKDLGFNPYSTFAARADWKFTRRNHFYIAASNFNSTRQKVLERTITFQGQTFEVNTSVRSDLHAFVIAPGYQFDIIRRRRGHLGIGVQADLFNSSAKITAAVQAGGSGAATTAKASLLAPIPVAGPDYRIYLTNSPRLFLEGNVYGMYFFGYGNFVSTTDTLGLTVNKHISLNLGYQLGSRLVVTNSASADRLGLRLTQQGAIAGAEFSF